MYVDSNSYTVNTGKVFNLSKMRVLQLIVQVNIILGLYLPEHLRDEREAAAEEARLDLRRHHRRS